MALKTALLWGGAQTAIRMIAGFLSIKVTAVFLGPAGLALVGQLSNVMTLLQGGVGNAIQTGVVTLTPQAGSDKARLNLLWGTALRLTLGLGAGLALGLWVAAQPLSVWLFGDGKYWPVIVLVGACMPLVLANLVLTGALNGLKQINALGSAGVVSSLAGALIFIPACYAFGVWGGLIGAALSYLAGCAVSLVVVRRSRHLRLGDFLSPWDGGIARSLVAFYPMLIVHSIAEPAALLLVRDGLIDVLGAKTAGIWQANLRLSDMYTQVLMTALSLYLMPHLSSISDAKAFARELTRTVVTVAGLTALAAAAFFLLRDVVIAVVLTAEFGQVRELLVFQLIGDVLKMAGWPLRMGLVIHMRTRWYLFVEAGLAVTQVTLTRLWMPSMGVEAATAAYATAWGVVLLLLLCAYLGPGRRHVRR